MKPTEEQVARRESRKRRAMAAMALVAAILATALLLLVGGRGVFAQDGGAQPVDDGLVLARVQVASSEDASALAAANDVWEVRRDLGYALVATDAAGLLRLREAGYTVVVDVERTAQERAAAAQFGVAPASPGGGIPGYDCYRTVEETYADLAQVAADHPTLARWVDIGDSWDKVTAGENAGHDLFALEITNRTITTTKFPFVVIAAIHARELTTAETATRLAERLIARYGSDPDITWLLDYGAVYIVPQVNPDGRKIAEMGSLWRKNTHNDNQCGPAGGSYSTYGVDLNRNSSYLWNGCMAQGTSGNCSSSNSCLITYRGESAASEPETLAIEGYVRSVMADQRGAATTATAPATTTGIFISLHSYGGMVLWPWGWTHALAPNGTQLARLGNKFSAILGYYGCQAGSGCLYYTDGTTDDWSYGALGVASYTFELGSNFFQGCGYYESNIVSDTIDALTYGLLSARRPYQTPFGPDVTAVAVSPTVTITTSPFTLTAVFGDVALASSGDSVGRVLQSDSAVMTATWRLDTPPWITPTLAGAVAGGAMLPVDGLFDSTVETATAMITPTGWAPGRHILFVQATNGDGAAGMTRAVFLDVYATYVIRFPWMGFAKPSVAGVD